MCMLNNWPMNGFREIVEMRTNKMRILYIKYSAKIKIVK